MMRTASELPPAHISSPFVPTESKNRNLIWRTRVFRLITVLILGVVPILLITQYSYHVYSGSFSCKTGEIISGVSCVRCSFPKFAPCCTASKCSSPAATIFSNDIPLLPFLLCNDDLQECTSNYPSSPRGTVLAAQICRSIGRSGSNPNYTTGRPLSAFPPVVTREEVSTVIDIQDPLSLLSLSTAPYHDGRLYQASIACYDFCQPKEDTTPPTLMLTCSSTQYYSYQPGDVYLMPTSSQCLVDNPVITYIYGGNEDDPERYVRYFAPKLDVAPNGTVIFIPGLFWSSGNGVDLVDPAIEALRSKYNVFVVSTPRVSNSYNETSMIDDMITAVALSLKETIWIELQKPVVIVVSDTAANTFFAGLSSRRQFSESCVGFHPGLVKSVVLWNGIFDPGLLPGGVGFEFIDNILELAYGGLSRTEISQFSASAIFPRISKFQQDDLQKFGYYLFYTADHLGFANQAQIAQTAILDALDPTITQVTLRAADCNFDDNFPGPISNHLSSLFVDGSTCFLSSVDAAFT